MVETVYQMLEILLFIDRYSGQPPPTKITFPTFLVKKKRTMNNSGVSIFDNTQKNLKSNLVLVVVPVLEQEQNLESKGLN